MKIGNTLTRWLDAARPRHETDFLPAALEIVEAPPHPAGRAIMMTIAAFTLIALAWSILGHLDIIVTAEGRVIPTGKVKVIQPFETGVVKSIAVHDGQHVKAGDLLLELDPTIDAAEAGHVDHDLMAARLDAARIGAIESGKPMVAPEGVDPGEIVTARHLAEAQQAEEKAKLANLDRQAAQKDAEGAGARATIAKLKAARPMIEKRRDIRQYLSEQEYGSKLTYLEAQQQLTEQDNEMEVQRHRLDESLAAAAGLRRQREQAEAEYHHANLDKLAEDEGKIGSLREDAIKARERTTLQTLKSPVDGTVQQVSVHTVGGVVTPAQELMVVVPDDARLEVEATVENRDVGFVHAGQSAEVKVEAFTFTRYGLLHGKVTDVSRDVAAQNERDSSNARDKAGKENNQPRSPGYIATVSLDETAIDTETGPVALGPGMAVTVEIKTGRRRVIDYLLSPLKRYAHEGMRER